MTDLDVRIVRLEPMRVASVLGFGPNPEELAWHKLRGWAEERGLLEDLQARRFFGFNNPSPSPGSPNYGYEQWMTVGPEVQPSEGVKVFEFSGGLYAVTRCRLEQITGVWGQLIRWFEGSRYQRAQHQWLEECLTPAIALGLRDAPILDSQLDLYLPIAE